MGRTRLPGQADLRVVMEQRGNPNRRYDQFVLGLEKPIGGTF